MWLLIGIEMKVEPKDVVAQCKSNGLLVIAAGSNTVRFMPPLIVTKTQCDAALAYLKNVCNFVVGARRAVPLQTN